MVSIWWSAASLIHYNFLNPRGNHYSWEVCLANWWDAPKTATPAADTGQQKEPNSSPWQYPTPLCTTNTSKVEQTGLGIVALSSIFAWSFANKLPLLQISRQPFEGKTLPQPAGGRKMLSKNTDSRSMEFYATGINTLTLLAKMCWL